MGKIKIGILTLLLGLFATAAFAQPYWTGDRQTKDLASKALTDYKTASKAVLDSKEYTLRMIQDNRDAGVQYGPDFVSFQTIGTSMPYFVAPSLLNHPDWDQSLGVYPAKKSATEDLNLSKSTFAWSVVPATAGSPTPAETALETAIQTAANVNSTQIDLGNITEVKAGETYTISVKEDITGACTTTLPGWEKVNTQFGVTITGKPNVFLDARDLAGFTTTFTGVAEPKLQNYEYSPKFSKKNVGSLGESSTQINFTGKQVIMVASCDGNAIKTFAKDIDLKLLSYEQGIGQYDALKKYAFRVAKVSYAIKTDLTVSDYTNPAFVTVGAAPLVDQNTSVADRKPFTNLTSGNADLGENTAGAYQVSSGTFKSIEDFASSPNANEILMVDNVIFITSPKGVKDGTSGVVSSTSYRSDLPYDVTGTEAPNGYYGDLDATVTEQVAYALVIRNIPPPRTGPIYYVPNSLYK